MTPGIVKWDDIGLYFGITGMVVQKEFTRLEIIDKMRANKVKWNDIGSYLGISGKSACKDFTKMREIERLGISTAIRKSKFASPVVRKIRELARDNPQMPVRDFLSKSNKCSTKFECPKNDV